jgi:hypothetical protein
MLRFLPLLTLPWLFGCEPGVCGRVSITGVASNPDIERFRKADGADGAIDLLELCGADFGSFAHGRGDTGTTTLVLDSDIAGAAFDVEASPIARVLLPSGLVIFWSSNLVAGRTLTLEHLAGSGLHKRSESETYQVYPLTSAKLEVLEGPLNRKEESYLDTMDWSEEWRVRWAFEFGGGVQRWEAEDVITRSRGTEVGGEPFYPPDPKP